jgi:hypothetical protein
VPDSDIGRPLIDHLVGALLEMQWHVETERLGGLKVDHQLELDRGLDGKLARLRALENAIDIRRRAPKIIDLVISVGQQRRVQRKSGMDKRQGGDSEQPAM